MLEFGHLQSVPRGDGQRAGRARLYGWIRDRPHVERSRPCRGCCQAGQATRAHGRHGAAALSIVEFPRRRRPGLLVHHQSAQESAMIECKIDGHVAVITLNNPSANTFTAEGLLELTVLVGDLNRNLEVYAAVV